MLSVKQEAILNSMKKNGFQTENCNDEQFVSVDSDKVFNVLHHVGVDTASSFKSTDHGYFIYVGADLQAKLQLDSTSNTTGKSVFSLVFP